MDVKLAAKLADMDVQEFVSLNPGNSRAVIKADSERSLLLPADKAGTFLSNLETHNEPLLTWQAYKLKSGETVDRVAARYGIDVGQLKHVNSIKGAQRVGAGATLLVPRQGNSAPYLPDMPATHEKIAKAKKSAKHAHAARKGRPVKVADSRGTTRRVAAAGPKKSGTASAKSMVADHSD
jgi:membrane-bound lytic murein transglycosylase D